MWNDAQAMVLAAVLVVAAQAALSRAETAKLVTRDLAARLKIGVEAIRVDAAADRLWPDSTLGCGGKPLEEPQPVPGFSFTLSYQGRQYLYHTDRLGRFRRCDVPKPIGPIRR